MEKILPIRKRKRCHSNEWHPAPVYGILFKGPNKERKAMNQNELNDTIIQNAMQQLIEQGTGLTHQKIRHAPAEAVAFRLF